MMKKGIWFVIGMIMILSGIGWILLSQEDETNGIQKKIDTSSVKSSEQENKEKASDGNNYSTTDKESLLGKS